jgi:putative addiction module component (TIGR02574 family)
MRAGAKLRGMPSRPLAVDELTADERIELMGRLWDSLDPAAAAPITDVLAAELARREAEADAAPEDGQSWADVKEALAKKLR